MALVLLLAKLKWAAAFGAVVGLTLSLNHLLLPDQGYQVKFPIDTAAGLYTGSDVEIAGAKAGSVENVGLWHGQALVTISLDPQFAPIHRDAVIDVRPKSLLGEKYVSLDPGQAPGTFQSGSVLPASQVQRSVELEEVINSLDAPTRQKLQVLIDNLGGGLTGRGQETNTGIAYGTKDMDDLAALSDTLAQRDADLTQVIDQLSQVTDELAKSDRRQQLGAFIQNSDQMLQDLNQQDEQLKRALAETNAALGKTGDSLDGTGGNLNSILSNSGYTVHEAGILSADLGVGMDTLMPHLGELLAGIREGPIVFGGHDAYGYATRVNVVVGPATAGQSGPNLPGQGGSGSGGSGTPQQPAFNPFSAQQDSVPAPVQFLLAQGGAH